MENFELTGNSAIKTNYTLITGYEKGYTSDTYNFLATAEHKERRMKFYIFLKSKLESIIGEDEKKLTEQFRQIVGEGKSFVEFNPKTLLPRIIPVSYLIERYNERRRELYDRAA